MMALPPEVGVCDTRLHRGQDQQDYVVDQDQTHWKQETPKQRFPKAEAFLRVQSCEPAARGAKIR